MAQVEVIHEVSKGDDDNWKLCFQWVRYVYDDESNETGYRFIWRRSNNTLQAARGQARIPNASILFELLGLAAQDGWLISAESE